MSGAAPAAAPPLRVVILHPELGIGGAERLIVDTALGLRARGHQVALFTARCDPHGFAATRDGRLDVRVHAARLPFQLAGHLRLPLAVARMAALGRAALRPDAPVDAVLCDSVAQALPWLRRRTVAPIVFYGHYPDALLTPPRHGWYRAYRLPLDRWEGAGLDAADRLLVNSAFTAAAFRRQFPRLRHQPEVLHPGVDTARFAAASSPPGAGQVVLVISRLVPDKNIDLALEAFARVAAAVSAPLRLVVAGGFDARLAACHAAVASITARAAALGIADRLTLVRSPDDAALLALLDAARAVLYTPPREHFGYVPLEAMAAGRPVIAVADGGPAETIADGETGFLRPAEPEAFASALQALVADPGLADRIGAAGRARVSAHHSLAAYAARLEGILRAAITARLDRPGAQQVAGA